MDCYHSLDMLDQIHDLEDEITHLNQRIESLELELTKERKNGLDA